MECSVEFVRTDGSHYWFENVVLVTRIETLKVIKNLSVWEKSSVPSRYTFWTRGD